MKKIFVMIAALSLAACAQDLTEGVADVADGAAGGVATKLVFTPDNAVSGQLLICLDIYGVPVVELCTRATEGVVTRSGIETIDKVFDRIGVSAFEPLFVITPANEARARAAGLDRWYVLHFDENTDLAKAAADLAKLNEIDYVEFSQQYEHIKASKFVPLTAGDAEPVSKQTRAYSYKFNDPQLPAQWHYINIGDTSIYSQAKAGADVNCAEAWEYCTGDPSVVVAVIDEPVDWTHPDLAANMWQNKGELGGQSNTDDDKNGYVDDIYGYDFLHSRPLTAGGTHGTHVAGTISAVNNNRVGVCGIAGGSGRNDGVKIMSCQIFDDNGGGGAAVVARAFQYAADNGASVAQCSFGTTTKITSDRSYWGSNSAERTAINYFAAQNNCPALSGGVVIFAAGNDSSDYSSYPGATADLISVAAMSCDYTPAYYTNYGPGVNITAPGGDAAQSLIETNGASDKAEILSTVPGGYAYAQGTSMACPHMSGVAALALSYAVQTGKHLTLDEFKTALLTGVNDINIYCVGSKPSISSSGYPTTISLSPFRGKMGTGYVDALRVLMNIEGTPCVPVKLGSRQSVDIDNIVGGGASGITYLNVEISDADKTKLGIEGAVTVSSSGKLQIKCNKPGSARVRLTFIAGGTNVGSDTATGGMQLTKEFMLVARGVASNGGWL